MIMSQSQSAVPATHPHVLSFPDQGNPAHWKARFNRIFDHGKAHLLCFPFSEIRHKQALLDLYEAAGQVLEKYPAVAREFFADADIGFGLAEKAIEKKMANTPPKTPATVLQFKPKGGQHGK
jgi:hypothetical protein